MGGLVVDAPSHWPVIVAGLGGDDVIDRRGS